MPETTRHAAVSSEFAELVCADPAWVHIEFEAIVAANFDCVPPSPARPRPGSSGPPASSRAVPTTVASGRDPGVVLAAGSWARQRSPPRSACVPLGDYMVRTTWFGDYSLAAKGR
jgi:hypothetical protein